MYGWLAGVNAVIVSHPIDTIKTNIQEKKVIKHHISSLANSGLYQSLWFC